MSYPSTAGTRRRLRAGRRPAATASSAASARTQRSVGQSLVEFTLVLPLFLLVVAGMVDFGLGLYSNITVINAAREGARFSATHPGDTAATEARARAMAEGLNQADVAVTTTCQRLDPPPATTWTACSGTPWLAGDAVVVRVDYVYRMVWPLAFGTQIPLQSTVKMRIE